MRLPRLVVEKLPLFIPVAAASVLAVQAQSQAGSIPSWEGLPLGPRVANAVLSYGLYLKKLVWPIDLAVFYPHPGSSWEIGSVALAALVLGGISLGVWWQGRSYRYLVVGWLWYVGTLFPVSGLIQVGSHAMADRYAYVPLMGLFIMLVWGVAEMTERVRLRREWLVGAVLCLLVALTVLTRVQLSYWKSTTRLFEHTLVVTSNNHLAHNALSVEYMEEEEFGKAMEHLAQALLMYPRYADAHSNLGLLLARQGRLEDAKHHYLQAIQISPNSYAAHNNLGLALLTTDQVDEAIDHFSRALAINPYYAEAHNNLGTAIQKKGNRAQAMELFRKAAELRPSFAEAYYNLGTELLNTGHLEEAKEQFLAALEADPDYLDAYVNLGVLLRRQGRLDEAVALYLMALELDPDHAEAHNNLGTVLAQKGDLQQAVKHLQQALKSNPNYPEARANLKQLQSR